MRSPARVHLCGIQTAWTEEFDAAGAVAEVSAAILRAGIAQLIVFFSPEYDVDALAAELTRHFPDVPTVGCSTSGGICPAGAIERGLVAIAFPAAGFRIAATCLEGTVT